MKKIQKALVLIILLISTSCSNIFLYPHLDSNNVLTLYPELSEIIKSMKDNGNTIIASSNVEESINIESTLESFSNDLSIKVLIPIDYSFANSDNYLSKVTLLVDKEDNSNQIGYDYMFEITDLDTISETTLYKWSISCRAANKFNESLFGPKLTNKPLSGKQVNIHFTKNTTGLSVVSVYGIFVSNEIQYVISLSYLYR